MIIINADDFGRSQPETDSIVRCFEKKRITSASAMVFMADSGRAAEIARSIPIDLGLHLNLSQPFTGEVKDERLRECHGRVIRYLTSSKYSVCVYNPMLRQEFRYVYEAQFEEFVRLYGRHPSHIDGHHHAHLCTNMVWDKIIPAQERVRRSFSFAPGEKPIFNRAYRSLIDASLARRHKLTDYFFSLQYCLEDNRLGRVSQLSRAAIIELMTHPARANEYDYLLSREYQIWLAQHETGTYASL